MKNKYQEFNGKKYVKFSYVVKHRDECIDYVDYKTFKTLNEPILVWLDYKVQNEYFIIPPEYIFDFGSVPSAFRWISEKDEFVSYLVHDRLYNKDTTIRVIDMQNTSPTFDRFKKYGGVTNKYGSSDFYYQRIFADKFLRKLMHEENTEIFGRERPIQEFLVYWAIRIGGSRNFRKRNHW